VTDTPNAAITLTDKAAEKIGELLGGQAEGTEQALRVAVRGCRAASARSPVREVTAGA
jgi:Fe-S cluster assembly iron-binding protein IscA